MSITIGSVTINKNPTYESQYSKVRLNQYTRDTADGGQATYDNGPTRITGTITLRNVVKSEADSLRTYITGTANFQENTFTITPPANTDLGAGDGVAITNAKFPATTLDGVFVLMPPGRYDIEFPYIQVT